MNTLIKKLKKAVNLFRAKYPSPLPLGLSEFNEWYASFVELYDDLPTKDEASIKNVLAATIINLGNKTVALPKYHFYMILKASAAKQVAGAVFQELQIKQREARAAEAKAAAEKAALDEASRQSVSAT
jgi:hypothetical protein